MNTKWFGYDVECPEGSTEWYEHRTVAIRKALSYGKTSFFSRVSQSMEKF